MRISDWSSDVCSSDLVAGPGLALVVAAVGGDVQADDRRVEAGQAGVVEAELLRLVAAQVVDHRLGAAGQLAEAGLARGGLQVERHALLVGAPGLEILTVVGAEEMRAEERKSTRLNSSH